MALVAVRAGAVAALAVIAVTGATVAGLEQALTASHDPAPPPTATEPPIEVDAARAETDRPLGTPCAPPVRVCVQLSRSAVWLLATDSTALGPIPVNHDEDGATMPAGRFPVEDRSFDHVDSRTGAVLRFAILFADDKALYQAADAPPPTGSLQLPPGLGEKIFHAVSVGDLIEVVP